jgi:hypothetical protein
MTAAFPLEAIFAGVVLAFYTVAGLVLWMTRKQR